MRNVVCQACDGRTVESSAVFCLSRIRNQKWISSYYTSNYDLEHFTRHTIGWRAIWNDECNDLISDLKWKCKWKWKWNKNPIGLQWITLYRRIPQRHWLVSISEAIRRLPSMSGKNEEKNPSKNRKMKKKSTNEWKSTFSLGLPSYCWGWGRSRSIFMITLHEAIKQDHQRTNEAPDQTIILGLQIFLDHKPLSSINQKILMTPPLGLRSLDHLSSY